MDDEKVFVNRDALIAYIDNQLAKAEKELTLLQQSEFAQIATDIHKGYKAGLEQVKAVIQ